MKPELTYNCPMCEGREYHCYSYIDALATGQIHKIGEVCPFYDLWTSLYLAKEIKRLHLVQSTKQVGVGKTEMFGNERETVSSRDSIPLIDKTLDTYLIENNGDDGGW